MKHMLVCIPLSQHSDARKGATLGKCSYCGAMVWISRTDTLRLNAIAGDHSLICIPCAKDVTMAGDRDVTNIVVMPPEPEVRDG